MSTAPKRCVLNVLPVIVLRNKEYDSFNINVLLINNNLKRQKNTAESSCHAPHPPRYNSHQKVHMLSRASTLAFSFSVLLLVLKYS